MASPPPSDAGQSENEEEGVQGERGGAPVKRQEILKEEIRTFLDDLLEALKTKNVEKIEKLYEEKFNELSLKHYPKSKWPSVDAVKEQVSEEELFLVFYKELTYRHLYSRCGDKVTHKDRKGSWENYRMLLGLIIEDLQDTGKEDLALALPGQWIWDMLDEFAYHYQTYSYFVFKTVNAAGGKKDDINIEYLRENKDVWSTTNVLSYLHDLIKYSKIEDYLKAIKDPENNKGKTGGAFTDEPVRLLGYFALMQLLRLHSLLGDYHTALKTIECLDFGADVPLFYQIPACHVTLYYYMGFAYVMMRRYADAVHTFSDILVFLSKTSSGNAISYQYDQIVKKQEQMYALLIICLALCPRPIDESLEKAIREKPFCADRQAKLHTGGKELETFEEVFNFACPKFVNAAVPDLDNPSTIEKQEKNHERQKSLFLEEVKQQQPLPRIGSYMKLYTAIKMPKLAQLCEMDEEGVRDQLMCVMHKSQQRVRVHQIGSPLDGTIEPCSEVEFYLDGQMVHINAQKPERAHADVFLEQILKNQELLKKMGKI